MSTPRVVFAAVLVAAAWTTVVSGLVAVGAAKAEATWLKSGPGNAYGRGLTLAAPQPFSVTTVKCNGSNQQVSMSWGPVTGAVAYKVFATASDGTNGQVLTTTSATALTGYTLPYKPAVITVQALNNNWRGPASAPATGCP
ncbi:hypothetical protein [Amycolatopsis sp. NPDC051716]|uniref:hypothetical protein n=1 Tax=Amycolatopsis sp. NPDC051716 TaxID=3155804 RepID=UPI0034404A65